MAGLDDVLVVGGVASGPGEDEEEDNDDEGAEVVVGEESSIEVEVGGLIVVTFSSPEHASIESIWTSITIAIAAACAVIFDFFIFGVLLHY